MDRRIIFFNGPPRSGKDTCVQLLQELRPVTFLSIAAPLQAFANEVLPQPDQFEEFKDIPIEYLGGDTIRDMVISLSEDFFKKKYGKSIFAKIAAHKIRQTDSRLFVFNALGFTDELEHFIKEFGAENIFLVHLHRNGKDFSKDKRKYIYSDELVARGNFTIIHNNGTKKDLKREITEKILTKF